MYNTQLHKWQVRGNLLAPAYPLVPANMSALEFQSPELGSSPSASSSVPRIDNGSLGPDDNKETESPPLQQAHQCGTCVPLVNVLYTLAYCPIHFLLLTKDRRFYRSNFPYIFSYMFYLPFD